MKSSRNYATMTNYKIRLRKISKPNRGGEIFFRNLQRMFLFVKE